jgi:probable rRNA maturation factor
MQKNVKHKITVSITDQSRHENIDPAPLRKLARYVCRQFGLACAKINIALLDDRQTRTINKQFLGSAKNTDVISFDMSDPGQTHRTFEIVINPDMALRRTRENGHAVQAELALYLTHGLLHQLGFDDTDPRQAKKMHETEDIILRKTGYGPVYYQQ